MKEKLNNLKESAKKNANKIKEKVSEDTNRVWASLAYFPLIGWILAHILKRSDENVSFHAKQGMLLNIVFVIFWFVTWVITDFPLTAIVFGDGSLLNPIPVAIFTIGIIFYLGISGFALYKASTKDQWEIPYLTVFTEKVIAYFKKLG